MWIVSSESCGGGNGLLYALLSAFKTHPKIDRSTKSYSEHTSGEEQTVKAASCAELIPPGTAVDERILVGCLGGFGFTFVEYISAAHSNSEVYVQTVEKSELHCGRPKLPRFFDSTTSRRLGNHRNASPTSDPIAMSGVRPLPPCFLLNQRAARVVF